MYVEVRNRLGIANVYIPTNTHKAFFQSIQKDQVELHIQDGAVLALVSNSFTKHSNNSIKFLWPRDTETMGAPCTCKYKPIPNTKELSFRISIATSDTLKLKENYIFMTKSPFITASKNQKMLSHVACFSNEFDVKSKIENQKENSADCEQNLFAFCANCKNRLFEIKCFRVLPLPSINWKEMSNDWFCACVHTTSNQIKPGKNVPECTENDADEGSECKNFSSCEKGNRQLSNSSLTPKFGDILYSSAFLCLNSSSLIPENIKQVVITKETIHCRECKVELGVNDKAFHEVSWTLWHHAVTLTNDTTSLLSNPKYPMDTVIRLIESVLEESGKSFAQIVLREVGGQRRYLFLWILERNLCLLTPEDSEPNTNEYIRLCEQRVMKAMFTDNYKDILNSSKDIDVTSLIVGTLMIEEILSHLNENIKLIPVAERFQKGKNGEDLKLSYIFAQ